MVGIVSGNGLGLFNSSFNNLGKKGLQGNSNFGQAQLQNYVNIADGNLIIRQLDQNLSAIGRDIQSIQTYNSKGVLSGEAQWGGEWSRRLSLVGNLNTAGSKILVTAEDGHQITFNFSSTNNYISTEGDGAYDKLSISGNNWTITDGKTLATEVYEYNPTLKTGRLVALKDNNGTNLAYGYDSLDRLISIKDLNSTGLNELIYNYDGNSNRIKRIDTKVNGVTSQNVYYEYDSLNRLSKVITDLTPNDNSIADQKVYTTSYSYELTSSRIASITQSDGTSVQFTYELDSVTNSYRVKTVKDSQGLTTFTYSANKTTVENSLKEIWEYNYDADQQLISIKNANAEVTSFSYDSQGNVIAMVDNEGNTLSYRYDSNGNLIEEYNQIGKAIKYSYINNSQLATITEFNTLATKDANGNWVLPTGDSSNTNSVYDTAKRLRFVISAEGGVVEYSYNEQGQLISKAGYQNKYISGAAFATVDAWAKKNARSQLSSYEYDVLGNLKREINYSSINKTVDATTGLVNNQGVFEDATQLIDYVYDPRGLLLQKIMRHGANRQTAAATAAQAIQSFTYDGLGRILTEMSAAGTTTYSYAAGKITVTNAANLVTTQSFDNYGRLINIVQSATSQPSRTTNYIYDEAGRLVYTKQPTGNEQFNFYDKKGRLVGVVDSSGLLIEYAYNKNDLQTKEIRYANAVNSAGWLVNNSVAKKRVEEIRPAVNSFDRMIEKSYDSSGQLTRIKQANGTSIEYSYDNLGNLIQEKTVDRISRYFYNKENQQIAALDAEGYLVETIYNATGQKVQVNRHSKLTTESLRATGTLTQLKPTGTDNTIRSSLFFYNAQNQLVGSVDEKSFITAYFYDEVNNTVTTRQYSTANSTAITSNTNWADFIAKIPATNTYQETIKYYDNQGRLTKLSDSRAGLTSYGYDSAGRVITETLATGSTNERRVLTRYNAFGETTHVLAGEAALEIKTGMTAAQVDQVYEQYGIKSYYDAAGRKTHVLNAAGQLTTLYYDKSGRLTHRINAEGNVVETSYTIFGEVKTTTQYVNSLSKTDEKVTDLAGAAIPTAFSNAVGVGKRLKGGELTTTLTNLITAIKNATKDSVEKLEYDRLGNISKKTDAELNSIDFLYNQYGELDTETRQVTLNGVKKSVQTAYTYSKRGELKSVITDNGGLNQSTSKEYDAFGRVIKETDAKGNITSYDYSADQGRSIQVKSADNSLTKTTYDAWNRVLTVNSNTNITSYSYDDKARTLTVKSPEGLQTITRYNEFGDVIEITAANNGKTTYLYNKDGKTIKETNAAGAATSYVYDKNTGLLKESSNALGLKTEYIYDDANRIQSQIVTISATEKVETQYRYDGQGRRLEVIEAYGTAMQRSTVYNYDRAGRLASVVQDATGIKATTTYAYDETGREIRVVDKGITTVYSYDALGRRLSEIKDPTGEAIKTEYRYDANGNLTRKLDPAGNSTWYVYDSMNRLTHTVNSLGETSSSVYDLNGLVIAQYRYTALQNVSTWANKDSAAIADITVSKITAVLTRSVYNKDGLEIFSIDAEGSVVEKQYNELGKVKQLISYDKAVNLAGESLTAAGIKAALQTAGAGSRTESYYYDALGRMVYSIDAAGYITRNDYDAGNNIIKIWTFKQPVTLSRTSTLAQFDAIYKATSVPVFTIQYMYYDKSGRKVYDLNKNSVLTRYYYDELNNLTSKKELTIAYTTLLDLLRTKDEKGAYITARPAATIENYDAALQLLTEAQTRETNYYYDKLGRVKYIIDALGYVTRFNHNALNDVVNTVKYYDATSLSRSSTLEQLNTVYLVAPSTSYTITGTIYSVTGRKVLEYNELGFVTHYSYDALGHLAAKKETIVSLGALLDLLRTKDANGVLTARPSSTAVNINKAIVLLNASRYKETQYYYDQAGRLAYDINALGYVSSYRYDALGQLISSKQSNLVADSILDLLRTKDASGNFTTPRPELNTDNLEKAFKLVPVANYKENNSYYDKDGRLNYSIDAMNYVTRYSYDAYDNVISTIRFKAATALSRNSTLAQLDAAFKTAATLPEHTITQYGYDALNRKIKETDAEGFSVETGYDAFNNVIWVKDKLGNKGYFYYDALNRNTFKIDAEGYITFYYYDAFGNQTAERKYYQRVNGLDKIIADNGLLNTVRVLATATEVAPTNLPYLDYNVYYDQTSYQYDKLNRKTKVSDILGYYEEYTYNNGLTQPATYRNKLGGVYSYVYDKVGRLIQETLPELAGGKAVINSYEYDAYGNRTKLIEAKGLTEQRVSVYQYDALNRLTAKVGEAVSTTQFKVTDASKPYLKNRTGSISIPKETYQYDGYGNQIAKTDANGASTYSYYDKNGRKVAEISPAGLLSVWAYNAAGQVTQLKSYETAVALPAQAGGALPVAPAGNVRVVEYGYDKVGRQTAVITPNISAYEYDSNGLGSLTKTTAVVKTYYDANGNVIRVEDGKGNNSYNYYDAIGRKLLSVDAGGYAIQWSYDYNSTTKLNSITETKYATRLKQSVNATDQLAQVLSYVTADGVNDRITISTLDRKGRVSKTELLNVKYTDGTTTKVGNSVTSFTYNGLDQVLTKTDSTGTVRTDYDKLGRETLRTFGEYKDSNNVTVKQRISSVYNGLGLLSSSAVLGINDAVSTDDRITQYSYDKLGRLTQELDVNLKHAVNYAYDLVGNQTWVSTERKTSTAVLKTDETLIEYDSSGKEITRRVSEGSRASDSTTAITWKIVEERETRYNVFGEVTGKRLVKPDSTTKATDPWQEVTEYNNQGKVWKSNANNGVTRYYLYDRNGNATLQLDTTGSTTITAKTPDQLKDLTGVTYTETVYDQRNQVAEVRQPKYSQESLDTTLNIFGQTISRTTEKSTVALTDTANKLKFDANTQKLSIQANAQATRVIIKYWPKGSASTPENTFTIDMQAGATAGAFVLDISTIKANADFNFSYSSSNAAGQVLDSSTGTIKRSVNVVDVFSGGSVTANPTNTTNSVANTMSTVAVDIFNDYRLPITLVGQKIQKILNRDHQVIRGAGDKLTFTYEEGMVVQKIQFALPSQLQSFGNGNFEVELSINGQTYKRSVSSTTTFIEFPLDLNEDKFLGGKSYNIKIYKRVSPTVTELVMNSSNEIPNKLLSTYVTYTDSRYRPPMFYSNAGDILDLGSQVVDHQGILTPYNHLIVNNVPTGTSRVEVKYKLQGASQWSTLTTSAPLYKNMSGWYQVNLSALQGNRDYDYQYITYNAKGDVLGGGQGIIYTANNQAGVNQKALSVEDMPNVYKDKNEVVNGKQDINNTIYKDIGVFNATYFQTKGYLKDDDTAFFGLEYTFNNNVLRKYGKQEFALVVKNRNNGELVKTTDIFYLSAGDVTKINLDIISAEFKRTVFLNNTANYQVTLVYKDGQNFIPIASCDNDVRREKNGHYYDYDLMYNYSYNQGAGSLNRDLLLRLNNQSINTTHIFTYYRELGSKAAYSFIEATPLRDIYGATIPGAFDIDYASRLDPNKKYEIQYVSYAGQNVINRQQGTITFTAEGMQVNTSPLNYGGDGFMLFYWNSIAFFDQFQPLSTTSTVAQLKIRKVGSSVWENFTLGGTSNWFNWDFGSRNGEYEFKLDSYNRPGDTSPAGSIVGKLRLGAEPQVLSYIPASFVQNQITFSGQPTGSNKITVKYGTVAGQLNQTANLTVGADRKAILDATAIAELNLLGSTTVYYSYETTDANNKVLNRATGYINVGLGAGSGQHTNLLNDSWIDLQPAQSNGTKMEVYYRKRQVDANGNFVSDLVNADINSDAYWGDKAQFTTVTLTPQNGIYRWDINNLIPKDGYENYEYFYQLYDASGKVIAFVPGKVTVDSKGNGSTQQTKWAITGSGSEQSQIIRRQEHNAFGEITSETDGNGYTTTLSYNTLGKLVEKKLPTVDIRKADGSVVQGTPTLEYGYDLAGRLLVTKDANGNINKQSYVNGHNLETGDWLIANETHADAGQVINGYDVFGNLLARTNEIGIKTGYEYDLNGNLVKINRAPRTAGSLGADAISNAGVQQTLTDIFSYDELGNRITATNALNNTTTTDYDALGRVIQTKSAEGAVTQVDYAYDATIANLNGSKGGIKRTETDALGQKIIDDQDYYGRTVKHVDKGNHTFNYYYNSGGWLTRQTNSQGQNIDYSYYNNGSIKEIRDVALNLLTAYRYDDNGNRIEERYQELNAKAGEPRVFQNAQINYDALNRKISVQDQSFNIAYDYDANGNIMHMLANYRDAVNAAPKIQDFWYRYDRMNRFEISMGVLNSTTKMVERGATGVEITYDKLGQRTSADYGKDALNSSKAHRETYFYTTDGYLETVKNADYDSNNKLGTPYFLSTRANDALGRVKTYRDYNPNSNSVYQTTENIYNKDNQITNQTKTGGNGEGSTVYTYLADKVTLDKTVMTPPPNSGPIQSTQYQYEWWDSAKQKSITTKVNGLEGVTNFSYDVNGHVSGFTDTKNTKNQRQATYINNSQGMVLQRNELINGSMNRYRNFYYVNGQRIGDVSNDGPSREDYVQSLQNSRSTPTQAKDFKPISSADFDQNFEPINAQYPSSAPTTYVVNNGDTLQSIALSVWGDASMWYMIADLNGLSPSDKLTAGQVLSIPNKVTNIHNNSETFRPYNPGEAIGDTQPTVPSPPPPPKPKKKCGGIAQIVMIVVAVVVTIYTAGAASAAFGALAAGTSVTTAVGTTIASGALFSTGVAALGGASIGAAMVGAAVGSAASQLVGKAMGAVDSFSWSQVGVSALTAGATAGVGAGIGQLANNYNWAQTASNAINAVNNGTAGWTQAVGVGAYAGAVGYGSNYISNQVFGNNQSFSWAALGSSIVGSMAGAGLGRSGAFNAFGKSASPYAYSIAGASAAATIEDKWFGGARPDYLNVSMAAIANTVGTQFGEKSADWLAMEVFLRQTRKDLATAPLYAMSVNDVVDKAKTLMNTGLDYIKSGVDYVSDIVSDYLPNNAAERSRTLMSGGGASNSGSTMLPSISVKAMLEDGVFRPSAVTYALGGVRGFNMSVALDNIQQSRMSQTRAELRPLNKLEAFYRDYHIQPFVNGVRTLGHGMVGLAREGAYTSFDAFAKRVNPRAKPESWFFQSLESQGIYSTGKTIVQNVAVGTVDGVLNPFRALVRNDYDAFAESLPNFAATIAGGKIIQPAPKPVEFITLYHGTSKAFASDIRVSGIDITKSKASNDFGEGFYLTSSRDDAISSATMQNKNLNNIGVLEFRIPKDKYNDLNHLEFNSPNKEWQDFVTLNKGIENYIGKNGNVIPFYRPPQEWNVKIENHDIISGPLFRKVNSEGKMLHWEKRQPQVVVRSPASAWLFNQYMVDK